MEQDAAEIHPDEAPTMEVLRRYAAGEPVPGRVQNPELHELPNPRRDGSSQRIGGQAQASELRTPVARTGSSCGRSRGEARAVASRGR